MSQKDLADDELFEVLKYGLCKCGNVGQEEHPCPFAQDIHGDLVSTCNCCKDCVQNCIDDI